MPDPRALHQLQALAYDVPVTEYGVTFQTDRPLTFEYLRRLAAAPYFGEEYQQDIEPGGQYVCHRSPHATPAEGIEFGTVHVQRPLVLLANRNDPLGGYDDHSWKMAVWEVLKPLVVGHKRGIARPAARRRGEKLRRLLVDAGYDALVTIVPAYGARDAHTSEIVLLATERTTGAVPTDEDERFVKKRAADEESRKQVRILLEEADPSPQRPSFAGWLTSLITQRGADGRRQLTDAEEDAGKVREVLLGYLEIRRQNRLPRLAKLLGRSPDLNQPVDGRYVTYRELRDAVRQLVGKSKAMIEAEEQVRSGMARLLVDEPDRQIFEVSRSEGCPPLFEGTDWCVRFEETASEYLDEGNLFLFRLRDSDEGGSGQLENAALVFYGGGAMVDQHIPQFADINDDPLDAVALRPVAGAIAWIGSLGQLQTPPLRVTDDHRVARLMYALFLDPQLDRGRFTLTLADVFPGTSALDYDQLEDHTSVAIGLIEEMMRQDEGADLELKLPPSDPHNRDLRTGVTIRCNSSYLSSSYIADYVESGLDEAEEWLMLTMGEILDSPGESPSVLKTVHPKPPDAVIEALQAVARSLPPTTKPSDARRNFMRKISALWWQERPASHESVDDALRALRAEIPLMNGLPIEGPLTTDQVVQLTRMLQAVRHGGTETAGVRTITGVLREQLHALVESQYLDFLARLRTAFNLPQN